ncbi:mitochondrial large subunit ribosomal protein-domain-containing protein [Panaeolus papilionaceus]|nr:mitochondrial large subunit ribosomal protein-domain-containing protein [Panaeolus papilionaceus]
MFSILRNSTSRSIPRCLRTLTVAAPEATQGSALASYPYHIPRNTKGNLPVYSDVRNNGGRYLVLVRNVEGSVEALVKNLRQNLFDPSSEEAAKLKVEIKQSKHLIITGGRWQRHIVEFLKKQGF